MALPQLLTFATAGAATFAAQDAYNLYNRRFTEAGLFQSSIRFPSDLNRNAETPFMSLQFSAYRRRSINEQPFYQQIEKIALPIPENLVESYTLGYGKENLGSVIGSLSDITAGVLQSGVPTTRAGVATAAGTAASGLGVGLAGIAGQIAAAAATRATGGIIGQETFNRISQAAQTLSGITTNPFQVVLFKAPEFRSHQFSWKLVPRSVEESETIRTLIETFRFHSHPGISSTSGVFFSYPEILEIKFSPRDQYLYKFKPCVVESVSANFAPNSPSFYRSTGAPTAVNFTIKLQEIEIWTKADYLRELEQTRGPTTPPPRAPVAPIPSDPGAAAVVPGSPDPGALGLTR